MSWRGRVVVLGLAAAALVGIRYHKRLFHLLRRLLPSTHSRKARRSAPTLIGLSFPRNMSSGVIYTSPANFNPLGPDPTSFILYSLEDEKFTYFTLSLYGLLRSFTPKPVFHPAVKVCTEDIVFEMRSTSTGHMLFFALNDTRDTWGVVLSFTPLPRIVKTGPLLGITPDLFGELEEASCREFFKDRDGLLHFSVRPNGDFILVLGRHVNQDTRISLLRFSLIDYGWDLVAYNSHTIPNRLLAIGIGLGADLSNMDLLYDDDGVEFVQDPYPHAIGQSSSRDHIKITIEYDVHHIFHRMLYSKEKSQWVREWLRREWLRERKLSQFYVDKKQRLWFYGFSHRPLSLQTLAFLALARKFSAQLDQLASLPRGLESIGIPASIGREYRRQLAWATLQPPLILDLTASPPFLKPLFTSVSVDVF